MRDRDRWRYLALCLYEDGGDGAALLAQCDRYLVQTDAGVADGVSGQQGQHPVRLLDPVQDRAAPVVGQADLLTIDPDFVPVRLQVAA